MSTITTVESIAELTAIQSPVNGQTIYVKSAHTPINGTKKPFIGGGEFIFSADSHLISDSYIVIDAIGGQWIKCKTEDLTVDDFGAKGDNTTDDSDSFQSYVDSPYTSSIVFLPNRPALFAIYKEVDFKGKGLIGKYTTTNNPLQHDTYSIRVKDGYYPNNVAFKNVENVLISFLMCSDVTDNSVNAIDLSRPYDMNVDKVNILRFNKQITSTKIFVNMRFSNITSMSAKSNFIYSSQETDLNTTVYLTNCLIQWCGSYVAEFMTELWSLNMINTTFEECKDGLKAKFFKKCNFIGNWLERTGDNSLKELLTVTMWQQNEDIFVAGNTNSGGWWRLPSSNTKDQYIGGVIADKNLSVSDTVGRKLLFTPSTIEALHDDWLAPHARNLDLIAPSRVPSSGYSSRVRLKAGSGNIVFMHDNNENRDPINLTRQIGEDSDTNILYGSDVYTPREKSWSTKEIKSGSTGKFHAALYLTYDSNDSFNLENNGWAIKHNAVGSYELSRVENNTVNGSEAKNAHLIISPIHNDFVHFKVTPMNSYPGSWSYYRAAAGYTINFSNLSGAAIDVDRFSVALTLTN